MLEEGPDEEDQERGFLRENGKLYWVDPKGEATPLLYNLLIDEFKRMTHAQHAQFMRTLSSHV
jgi:hypothetical protein